MTSKLWRNTNALISETLIKRDIFCDDVYCRKKLLKRALEEDDEVGPEISWFQCFIGVFILTFHQFTFILWDLFPLGARSKAHFFKFTVSLLERKEVEKRGKAKSFIKNSNLGIHSLPL